ncbi:TonB-dependent receptor [Pseudoxanthomonas sacheonensis]|uniref:Iron complex outermembrane receptor protein n=1 Tax=Pseudoxanthomonas sacheonensis TaxID=443615 RepID=A0ABU1RXZ0_9GAMM|nr:TonB-dependent receptor [Pseudoxanthomonas sacheonensis]MDR6842795.1 iron complex outermembrane receptor protein [Pseudoxanthomonas sacheonensis]
MKHVPATFGVFLLAAAVSASVHAQQAAEVAEPTPAADSQDATNLDAVIVTGSRSPKAIDKIPGAITLVSKEEIKNTLAVTEDATAVLARTVPGYAESSQAMSNSGETLRGRIALRLFDGVPQGSPLREGNRNATFTDMGIVDRIEVINGPSASEGIGAAGGIINYISSVPQKEGNEFRILTRYSTQFGNDSSGWKVGANWLHKQENYDFVVGVSAIDRGISYDADGRRVGMNTSGSVSDSMAQNLFLKGGINFGEDGMQRLQASYSHFKIEGNGDYIQVEGCRPGTCENPVTNTSERGHIFGSKAEFNDFEQLNVLYSDGDFLGGTLLMNAYWADQAMRYLPENGDDKQLVKVDDDFDEADRIYDQSEIDSKKYGFRPSWTRSSLFGVEGLELRTGIDFVRDEAQQRLALTNRVWVPPMEYTSTAPYAQLSYDLGPVTFSGGFRREDGELKVDSYTTTAFRNSVFVQGGGVEYTENLLNFGTIWRITDEWSVFASYGEGFSLPNIGIPLRNINVPGQSVDRIRDIQPIIVDNREYGFNWRGDRGSFGGSYYDSRSPFGTSLSVDPETNDYVLNRAPTRIKGVELSGEWRFNDQWKASALYSRIRGKTAFWNAALNGDYPAGGLNKPIGVSDINPDKIGASVTWKFNPNGDVTLNATKLMSRDLSGEDVREFDGEEYEFEEHTNGYTLFDLSVNYRIENVGRFTVGVENLFDKQYILSWSQVDFFKNYFAGRGRMVSFTYEYTF